MTTTRTPIRRGKRIKITPEVIAAYRRALKLTRDPKHCDHKDYEYSREYYDACGELHELLGRDPGDTQVLDTLGFDKLPTELPYKPWCVESWEEAFVIRLELERLSKP
jgi:hypothetical protein